MSSCEQSAGSAYKLKNTFVEDPVTLETLERTLGCLGQLAGVSTSIVDLQGNIIAAHEVAPGVCALILGTEKGRSDCATFRSALRQRAVQQHNPCQVLCRRTGMVEGCVPVIVGNVVSAICHIGPCYITGMEKPSIEPYLRKIGLVPTELPTADRKSPALLPRRFMQLVEIPWLLVRSLNERNGRSGPSAKPDPVSDVPSAERVCQDDLQRQVIERTEQLTRLRCEFEEFAYVVSHDLKAPLRAASQLARWIVDDQQDSLNEDGKEMIGLLMSRLDRMNNLLEGILQYSRVGRMADKRTDVDLHCLVQGLLDSSAAV